MKVLVTGAAVTADKASANGFWAYNVPSSAFNTMNDLSERNNTIKSVAFAPKVLKLLG